MRNVSTFSALPTHQTVCGKFVQRSYSCNPRNVVDSRELFLRGVGPLHIGGLRTALFNYLFAKKKAGVFVLRIEDTDQSRYVKGSEDYIQEALEWCGMYPDEGPKNGGEFGPYRQSERKNIYAKHIQNLLKKGAALPLEKCPICSLDVSSIMAT